ncbi:hypothetical protein GUITHDRAFT_83699 [Guillardia theta CCMP2712]|uniref:Endoribonuclease L-PSP/chorismate mutase-like domain-containing protein n=1 Tax=Guillardia theta (strain CCMP2712) TaxID=905079 RepID=L1I3W8_GUITC|nr:hypothetical protein GUITHDRAFT_83699 [Guillardia theta CCMP2712]EKX30752.1 hypothetical protein GUITHDRAFT_83699 [Guillardia theta CCMP2712]|eukprot:XP_005817732.1 hypothetical protein GUITHDRAFT_83699 [Guillardia theta CCMP2712]
MLQLPAQASAPAANYVPYTQVDDMVYISGQVPVKDGKMMFVVSRGGKCGKEYSVEEGYECAKLCAVNLTPALPQIKQACGGDLSRVERIVKLVGFVNAAPDFQDHPKVVNGASDLMVAAFQDKGRHARRSAVGVGSLPFNVAVSMSSCRR